MLPNCDTLAPSGDNVNNGGKLESILFSENNLVKAIGKLKNNGSPGYDGLPACVFKQLKYSLVYPLLYIFRRSFNTGELLTVWKTAIIVPFHKKVINVR